MNFSLRGRYEVLTCAGLMKGLPMRRHWRCAAGLSGPSLGAFQHGVENSARWGDIKTTHGSEAEHALIMRESPTASALPI